MKTHKKLEELKENMKVKSFDELLSELVEEKLKVNKSMFGSAKGIKSGFLRNHNDRL